MTESTRDRQRVLRYALVGNASFSTITGVFIIIAHDWLAHLLGVSGSTGLVGLGVGLLLFAATLMVNARRPELKLAEAWAVVIRKNIRSLLETRAALRDFKEPSSTTEGLLAFMCTG